jgi:hypothetical protein
MQLHLIRIIFLIASNIDYMLQYLFYDKNKVIIKFIVDN